MKYAYINVFVCIHNHIHAIPYPKFSKVSISRICIWSVTKFVAVSMQPSDLRMMTDYMTVNIDIIGSLIYYHCL